MKDIQKLMVSIACTAIACGLVWAIWHGPEQSPVTLLFFGVGLAVLASAARRTEKIQLSEKSEALQVSKI